MFYINYLIQFDENKVEPLFKNRDKINTINFDYIEKLDFKI